MGTVHSSIGVTFMENAMRSIILLTTSTSLLSSAHGFKMGSGDEYRMLEGEYIQANSRREQVREDLHGRLFSFGDPIHEDMTEASKSLALRLPAHLSCGASREQIDALLEIVPERRLGHAVCCASTAKSYWCDSIDDSVRYPPFKDQMPSLIAGTRWNDDACHMTHRPETIVSWAAWMLDRNFKKRANLNYSSHYHDKQFLHSMASTGFGRSDKESRTLTTHKIMTWAEFAFRVADGSIPADTRMRSVSSILEPHRSKAFIGAFAPYGNLAVGTFFSGTTEYSSQHVRQIALGALLHTVQDSFSASHVERERSDGRLSQRGKVIGFMDYRQQDPRKHAVADQRPADAIDSDPLAIHPVSLGARLIACAATESGHESSWSRGTPKSLLLQVLEPADPQRNPIAVGGRSFQK